VTVVDHDHLGEATSEGSAANSPRTRAATPTGPVDDAEPRAAVDPPPAVGPSATALSPARIAVLVACWLGVLLTATVIVVYPLGPVLQQREQHRLLGNFRTRVQHSADAKLGLAGALAAKTTVAPSTGDGVAILDLVSVRVRQAVIEGVGPGQTRRGPGHVPGTAGLGQPGNAVIVGRRAGWGGPFARLRRLRRGDEIVATTTQGQSVYRVRSVTTRRPGPSVYGPSTDDRLTLLTSASGDPFSTDRATVVVARLEGQPFEPQPQGGRTAGADGRRGETGDWAQLALFGLAFGAVAAGIVLAQRRWTPLSAYLLTTPALVVLALLVAESASRLLPAWS